MCHVDVVIDYAGTRWNSRWLRGHDVGVVVDYADTDKTTPTLSENFEAVSQILKQQSGEQSI